MAVGAALSALSSLSQASGSGGKSKLGSIVESATPWSKKYKGNKGDWWKNSLTGFGILGGGGEEEGLEDIRSEDQKQAQGILQQLATTGSGGGINLGEAYGGQLFDPTTTGYEQQGLAGLSGVLGGQDMARARETFGNLADTKFDPSDPSTGFGAFSRALAREGKASEDVLNRESAISGGRFGTAIGRNKVDLAERMQDIRGSKLAEIFQGSRATQLAGAQGLSGLAGQQAGISSQLLQQGGLERDLKNTELQAKLGEFMRARGETLGRIDLLGQEASRNPYIGVSSLPGSPSAFSGLINTVLGAAGKSGGEALGKGISNKIGGWFNQGGGTASSLPTTSSYKSILGSIK